MIAVEEKKCQRPRITCEHPGKERKANGFLTLTEVLSVHQCYRITFQVNTIPFTKYSLRLETVSFAPDLTLTSSIIIVAATENK